MTDASTIRAIIERYVATWNGKDATEMIKLFGVGATIEDPVGTGVHDGLEAVEAQYAGAFAMVGDAAISLTGPIRVAGLEAAFPLEVDIDLGGRRGRLPVIDTMTFTPEGLITSMRAYVDADMMKYDD